MNASFHRIVLPRLRSAVLVALLAAPAASCRTGRRTGRRSVSRGGRQLRWPAMGAGGKGFEAFLKQFCPGWPARRCDPVSGRSTPAAGPIRRSPAGPYQRYLKLEPKGKYARAAAFRAAEAAYFAGRFDAAQGRARTIPGRLARGSVEHLRLDLPGRHCGRQGRHGRGRQSAIARPSIEIPPRPPGRRLPPQPAQRLTMPGKSEPNRRQRGPDPGRPQAAGRPTAPCRPAASGRHGGGNLRAGMDVIDQGKTDEAAGLFGRLHEHYRQSACWADATLRLAQRAGQRASWQGPGRWPMRCWRQRPTRRCARRHSTSAAAWRCSAAIGWRPARPSRRCCRSFPDQMGNRGPLRAGQGQLPQGRSGFSRPGARQLTKPAASRRPWMGMIALRRAEIAARQAH